MLSLQEREIIKNLGISEHDYETSKRVCAQEPANRERRATHSAQRQRQSDPVYQALLLSSHIARQERLAPLGLLSSMADLAMQQSDLTNDEGSEYLADAARYFRMKAGGATSEELQAAHDNLCRRLVALGPDLGDDGDELATNGGKPMPAARPSPVDRNPASTSPRYLAQHGQRTMDLPGGRTGERLLLNVTEKEFHSTRRNRA